MLKLYLLQQNKVTGYDTFDSAVVVAEDRTKAAAISIGSEHTWPTDPADVEVTYLGKATPDLLENSIICSSFNAG